MHIYPFIFNRSIGDIKSEVFKVSNDLNMQNKNNEDWERALKISLKKGKTLLQSFDKESASLSKAFNERSSEFDKLYDSIYNKKNNNILVANKEVQKL